MPADRKETPDHCDVCGYTEADKRLHGDHRLCPADPDYVNPRRRSRTRRMGMSIDPMIRTLEKEIRDKDAQLRRLREALEWYVTYCPSVAKRAQAALDGEEWGKDRAALQEPTDEA